SPSSFCAAPRVPAAPGSRRPRATKRPLGPSGSARPTASSADASGCCSVLILTKSSESVEQPIQSETNHRGGGDMARTKLQELALEFGVEAFPFGEALDRQTLEAVLRAEVVPEDKILRAKEADAGEPS